MYRAVVIFLLPFFLLGTKYSGEFQELGVGGRTCAMGGSGVAQHADASVLYFNPAASFFTPQGILVMHAENFGGIVKNEYGSVVLPHESLALGLGVQYVSVGGIKLTELGDTLAPIGSDNPPIAYDTVGTKDIVLYITGAKGNALLSYGASIKVYYRDLYAITGYGGGLDVGLMLNADYLVCGLAIRDFVLSPLIWGNGTRETIVPKLSFGVAPRIPLPQWKSEVTFECDMVKTLDIKGFDIMMGMEYAYKDIIFGRLGLFKGMYTLGIGLKYRKFSLDYAFITHSELDNSNKISAGFAF